jgi:hypothetical protein
MIPVEEPRSTIVSMIHQEIREEKPGLVPNVFTVKAGSIEKPSITHIKAAKHFVYLDDTRGSLPVRDASYEVARSIVEDYTSSQLAIAEGVSPGIFWVPGELTLKEIEQDFGQVLAMAKVAHMRWCNELIKMADNDFAQHHKHNVVSGFQRKVAEIMKADPLKHEWMNVNNSLENESCPGCGVPVRPGLIIHGGPGGCGFILDKKRYNPADFSGAAHQLQGANL